MVGAFSWWQHLEALGHEYPCEDVHETPLCTSLCHTPFWPELRVVAHGFMLTGCHSATVQEQKETVLYI